MMFFSFVKSDCDRTSFQKIRWNPPLCADRIPENFGEKLLKLVPDENEV